MNERILLIEDEAGLVKTLSDRLKSEGYQVETAGDGEAGFARATSESFDLILLDVMLPKKNGFDVCHDLRQKHIETPTIMLTARGELTDKVVGLKLGADDYVTKPFEMVELLARVEALLRRVPAPPIPDPDTFRFGSVCVDFRKAEVQASGIRVDLSAREFALLRYFITHQGAAISREALLGDVWGYHAIPAATRTVDVHIAWLRQKLEPNPRHPQFFLTVHGLGYKFVG
jgi:two-component system alkaline phosphatase synthesis response regulator PhoP